MLANLMDISGSYSNGEGDKEEERGSVKVLISS